MGLWPSPKGFGVDLQEHRRGRVRLTLSLNPTKLHNMKTQRYPVGTTFTPRGKHATIYTVTDYHTTTNLRGEVVRARYVTEHTFLGQRIRSTDIVETTIARGSPSGPGAGVSV